MLKMVWHFGLASFPATILSDVGEDLMAAPASQAYVDQIFSLCGQLTVGKRNRLAKSLEMRAFLKLNSGL